MRALIAAAILMMGAGSAQSATIFTDGFDGEGAPGASILNYNSFANWTVVGQVDLVNTGNFGITCPGKCVDLDGSSGPGRLVSKSFAYTAGKMLTLRFDVSGSQRTPATDSFLFTANFGQLTDINGFANLGGFDPGQINPGNYTGLTTLGNYNEGIAGARPFLNYGLSWTPVNAGTMTLEFWTTSGDNFGPILDSVVVSQVPEPSSWVMLIAGFGLVGAAARRRKLATA
ncbi:PEPxxWA-CTERM sorting domain-containing protein [Sandarakinorhabdus sp.]|uniref:PEPxxWA-CTERM sorting domain-containing protein n=1 Tax=Sandarakinorhabdus sp. TaxID=1916663 RepID=UPI00286D716A|nr:PEPxxWA-CTERM sorting domain-containing protein [Sandarakinorhabdus sp.]